MGDLEVFSSDASVPKLEAIFPEPSRKIKLYCWYSISHRQRIEYQVKLSVYPKNAFFSRQGLRNCPVNFLTVLMETFAFLTNVIH